ncbi:MAG: hypothetical protein AB8B69_02905 [Chitinophagales bacterium]
MIKVSKKYDKLPEALTRTGCKRKIKRAIEAQSGKGYNGHHYKDGSVKGKLNEIYKDKCAYCESKIEHAASLQVEHYRPKDGLTEEASHKGYYWLGCEWSNLLLACPKCNGKGAKGTKFPIEGIRIQHATAFADMADLKTFDRARLKADCSDLLTEKPLLLNPELDEPTEHLTFDADGQIEGKTTRGVETIKICKLDRDLLFKERKQVRDTLLLEIKVAIEGAKTGKLNGEGFQFILNDIFNKLSKRKLPIQEYSLWTCHCFDNFSVCFVQKLPPPFQKAIQLAFEAYKKNEL